jgi:hypothetical protein
VPNEKPPPQPRPMGWRHEPYFDERSGSMIEITSRPLQLRQSAAASGSAARSPFGLTGHSVSAANGWIQFFLIITRSIAFFWASLGPSSVRATSWLSWSHDQP